MSCLFLGIVCPPHQSPFLPWSPAGREAGQWGVPQRGCAGVGLQCPIPSWSPNERSSLRAVQSQKCPQARCACLLLDPHGAWLVPIGWLDSTILSLIPAYDGARLGTLLVVVVRGNLTQEEKVNLCLPLRPLQNVQCFSSLESYISNFSFGWGLGGTWRW